MRNESAEERRRHRLLQAAAHTMDPNPFVTITPASTPIDSILVGPESRYNHLRTSAQTGSKSMNRISISGTRNLNLRKLATTFVVLLLASGWGDPSRGLAGDSAIPEGVTFLQNIPYREGGIRHCQLDLAMPSERGERPRAAIVVIHGGGWLEGDKSSFSTLKTPGNILGFAKLGFVAVTINYRLSTEAPYPAALDDCRCAVRWLRAHADQYHLNPNRIGAWGNSAGGHLAMLLGMTERTPGNNDGEQYSNLSSRVQSVVSDSGPLDLTYEHQQATLRVVIEKFMGGPPEGDQKKNYERAS